ncbi:condensation domain protein [Mycobacterium xenopi 3993]|nr:condensation domain protein [Mycobacterium xenopi 3993]
MRCSMVLTPDAGEPAGQIRTGRRGVALFRVPAETTRAITALARASHTTVNTVLQAGFAQLLMLVTGHQDVAFGTTVSGGRPRWLAPRRWWVC